MALHDWSQVTDNVFHNFHVMWLAQLAGALNGGLLPDAYIARAEEYLWPYQADVLTLKVGGGVPSTPTPPSARPEPTVTIAPPRFRTYRQRRIAIFSARDERRVAVVEVISPGNKDTSTRAQQLQNKLVDCLATGLHVLVIDVLPATECSPGIAADVASEIGSEGVPREGTCVTSFEVEVEPAIVRVYHAPLSVGAPIPPAPLFLEPGHRVDVPLDETYARAVSQLPRIDRERLEA